MDPGLWIAAGSWRGGATHAVVESAQSALLRHGAEAPVVGSALENRRHERDPAVPRRIASGFDEQDFNPRIGAELGC